METVFGLRLSCPAWLFFEFPLAHVSSALFPGALRMCTGMTCNLDVARVGGSKEENGKRKVNTRLRGQLGRTCSVCCCCSRFCACQLDSPTCIVALPVFSRHCVSRICISPPSCWSEVACKPATSESASDTRSGLDGITTTA